MKVLAIAHAVFLFILSVFAADSATYDRTYDNAQGALTTVACSDGANGLITKGYTTFGSIPTFPNIGGVPAVSGWNDPECGSCWRVTYNSTAGLKGIYMVAIDASTSFNMALAAMNTLTDGKAVQLGRVIVNATRERPTLCGLLGANFRNKYTHS